MYRSNAFFVVGKIGTHLYELRWNDFTLSNTMIVFKDFTSLKTLRR